MLQCDNWNGESRGRRVLGSTFRSGQGRGRCEGSGRSQCRASMFGKLLRSGLGFCGRFAPLAVMAVCCWGFSLSALASERIVVLGSEVAEAVVDLGRAADVVGKDWRNSASGLDGVPEIGTHRNVSLESILAVKPTMLIGTYMTNPRSLFEELPKFGVKSEMAIAGDGARDYAEGVKKIGALLGPEESKRAEIISDRWMAELLKGKSKPTGKRYLLTYDGNFAAGKGTAGDELIALAGGINVAPFSGMKPMSREAWVEANPDVVVIAAHHEKTVGGAAGLARKPEVAASAAFKNGKIVFWPVNDYFLFGKHSPETVRKLRALAD